MKSIEETAAEIAKQYAAPTERFQLANAIEQALRDEQERCAKIAEARNAGNASAEPFIPNRHHYRRHGERR